MRTLGPSLLRGKSTSSKSDHLAVSLMAYLKEERVRESQSAKWASLMNRLLMSRARSLSSERARKDDKRSEGGRRTHPWADIGVVEVRREAE